MSEYQYYEFQTVDRSLTAEEQKAVRQLSSHIDVSASQASVEYSWGDFKHDPEKVVARYFDAMVYITNWGTRQLIFRFPKAAVETKLWQPYLYPNALSFEETDDFVVLNINLNGEEGGDWIEGEDLLSEMVPLRDDLLHGDLRVLYLAWLQFALNDPDDGEYADDRLDDVEEEEYEDDAEYEDYDGGSFRVKAPPGLVEPPVPAGLQKLSPALGSFIEFFALNHDLVTAAAATSPALTERSENLAEQIPLLSDAERNDFLLRLLRGEPRVDLALAARLRALRPEEKAARSTAPRRTVQSLIDATEEITEKQRLEAKRQQEAARLKKVQALAPQETRLWSQVYELIASKKVRGYDSAVEILQDLELLAQHQRRMAEFKAKITDIRARYPSLTGLQQRLSQFG